MVYKFLSVSYCTSRLYEDIISNGGTVEDVIQFRNSDKLSPLSKSILANINNTIVKSIFNPNIVLGLDVDLSLEDKLKLNKEEEKYSSEYALKYLLRDETSESFFDDYTSDSEKCYEIVIHPSDECIHILVIIKEGFLSDVTETKEVLLEFLLTVLRHGYSYGTKLYYIVHEYLALKLSDSYFRLVENRLDRR